MLLTRVAAVLFSLAIAVGITPQMLPAVVSTSLAAGSRRLAAVKVLVNRLVCIEDLGDLDILVTDNSGTLTEGRMTFAATLDESGQVSGHCCLPFIKPPMWPPNRWWATDVSLVSPSTTIGK